MNRMLLHRSCSILCLLLCHIVHAEWRGVDVSFLPLVEDAGGVFYNDKGRKQPLPKILKACGINVANVHLWHSPTSGCCSQEQALTLAKRLHSVGIRIILDFHFSDTWADPSQQTLPKAWANLTFEELKPTLKNYTRDVLSSFYEINIVPIAVQLGNEIAGGMLWPHGQNFNEYNESGHLMHEYDTPQQWRQLGQLLRNARAGLWEASRPWPVPKIIIHNHHGGSFGATKWFFDNLIPEFDNFDIIGLSYYPWFQGEMSGLQHNLEQLASTYVKEVAVVETAYPWTLDRQDEMGNFVTQDEQLHLGYPSTEQGQTDFILDLRNMVKNTPGGVGVVYWAPDWIATPSKPSAWENLALFDNQWKALPGLVALGGNTTTREPSVAPSQMPSSSPMPSSELSLSIAPSWKPSIEPSTSPTPSTTEPPQTLTPSDESSDSSSPVLSFGTSIILSSVLFICCACF